MLRRESLTKISEYLVGKPAEEQLIGREISRPTASFATRAWAENIETKMNDNNKEYQIELKHAHMQLLAERARVQDLEKNLKSLTAEKYSSQSSIIEQLRSSQDKLRAQLQLVIQSKMVLCESTALEIERLRLIIAELTNQVQSITGKDPSININSMINKMNKQYDDDNKMMMNNNNLNNMNDDDDIIQSGHVTSGGIVVNTDNDSNIMNTNNNNAMSLEEQLNSQQYEDEYNNSAQNPLQSNIDSSMSSQQQQMVPFPHKDISRIDIRTVKAGDGITYADPFAAVDLKYTGYKYSRDAGKWTKFTSPNISSTVFETRLGNHENIIGLEQAVLSMTKGEVAQVWVPSRLGYGVHGAEPLIPPNTDLIFELTLVEIRNDFAINGADDANLDGLTNINQDDDIDDHDGQYNISQQQQQQQQQSQHTQHMNNNDMNQMMNNNNYNDNNNQYGSPPDNHSNEMGQLYNSMVDDDDGGAYQSGHPFQVL